MLLNILVLSVGHWTKTRHLFIEAEKKEDKNFCVVTVFQVMYVFMLLLTLPAKLYQFVSNGKNVYQKQTTINEFHFRIIHCF